MSEAKQPIAVEEKEEELFEVCIDTSVCRAHLALYA
jgi:hypothetical protein